jgi:hypothetical protein
LSEACERNQDCTGNSTCVAPGSPGECQCT